jgi:hypothetical protein
MPQVPRIENIPDLRSSLEAIIDKSNEGEDENSLKNKIKTYIIESNIPKGQDNQLKGNFQLSDTYDKTLKILKARARDNTIREFYLDIADSRFWKLHSIHDSSTSESIIRNLVERNFSKLDYLWLPSTLLEKYMGFGTETGFSLKFKNKFGTLANENKIDDMSMRFWGGNAKKIIDGLRKNEPIEKGISLSSIGITHSVERGFAKENISYFGRFTLIKGNSIDGHFNLVDKIKSDYSNILKSLELNYRIDFERNNYGLKLIGGPLYIEFGEELERLDDFVNVLFSSQHPFRLSGTIKKENDSFYRVYGIDLHSNDLVNFEITPERMAIYLNHNSCANVITRLIANMQMYMTYKIKLMGEDDARII